MTKLIKKRNGLTLLGQINDGHLHKVPVDYRGTTFDYFLCEMAKDFLNGESTLLLNCLNEKQKGLAMEYLKRVKK